ncbi:DUF4143 domain-containing protein [Propioniciclava soli]|uniref:DUF4143 domain-containing protein n=1 Tax=Propioniciclava soli TaxID=2775081 RepID=A0ABZ3C736_9ACTN
MDYRRRIVDETLDDLFPHLAAIALEGAKGVGKTATATQRVATVMLLNNPNERTALSSHLDLVTDVPGPVLIDEWQLEPDVWDRVRRAVDDDPTGGRFLLAGSADVAPGVRIHSGAGRIVSLTMRPLAFSERALAEPSVSLRGMLDGTQPAITGISPIDLPTYTDEILRSGFPGIRDLPERARQVQLDSYLTRIVDRELPDSGVSVRRPAALRAWLTAYAAATATDATFATILAAATPGEGDKPARQTADIYRQHLQRIYLLDPIEAWTPAFSPLKRLTHSPKHHLVDPALAARLVGVGKAGLLRGQGNRVHAATGTWLGALFESLAAQSVRVYAEAADARVGHLRTKNTDHEVDLIVETADRSTLAIEVKLTDTIRPADVEHLNWLSEQLGDRLVDRMIIYTGTHAYRRPDGIAVVPLALLGP